MTSIGPLARSIGAAGIIAVLGGFALPALAGPAETALLKSYEGNWRGTAPLVGGDTENVSCRMTLSDGNDQKVNYNGRCSLAGTNLSINGTLAYVEANQRYEGAMTSNVNFSGVAVGQKSGDGIVFNLKSRGMADDANVEVVAGITLTPAGITIAFTATDTKTGKSISTNVPFKKS
jgi:hypothetical protein